MSGRLQCTVRCHPRRSRCALVRRATIGFLTDSFTDHYQLSLLEGVVLAARDRRANLLAYAGGVPTRPELPLGLGDERYGFTLLDREGAGGLVWVTVREQVSLALRF